MKTRISVAVVATLLLFTVIACKWFSSSETKPLSLEGKWIADTIDVRAKDSSGIIGLLFAMAGKDSLPTSITFDKDSSFAAITGKDTTRGKYRFSADQQQIFLTEDSTTTQFHLGLVSDSSFSMLLAKDSIYYHFRKQ